MEELIVANITIADRNYRVKINPADEEVVRHTVKIINDKVIEYKTNFAGQDMQDYIAMVLIWLATERNVAGPSAIEQEGFAGKLDKIEKMIDAQLG